MSYEDVQGFKNCKIGILGDCQMNILDDDHTGQPVTWRMDVNKLEWKNWYWAIEEMLGTNWLHNNEEVEMAVSQWLHGPSFCFDSF